MKVNVNWERLTDYIRTYFGESFIQQAEGAGIPYKPRFVPLRTIPERLPRETEVAALLTYIEAKHGYAISIKDVEAGIPPAGFNKPVQDQITDLVGEVEKIKYQITEEKTVFIQNMRDCQETVRELRDENKRLREQNAELSKLIGKLAEKR